MTTTFNSHAILVKHYTTQIQQDYNWSAIVKHAESNVTTNEWGEKHGSTWLGTTTGVYPSGKIYTCWTSNQTSSDVRRDEAFNDALEAVAEKHNGCISHEDDSIFFTLPILDHASIAKDAMDDAACFDINE